MGRFLLERRACSEGAFIWKFLLNQTSFKTGNHTKTQTVLTIYYAPKTYRQCTWCATLKFWEWKKKNTEPIMHQIEEYANTRHEAFKKVRDVVLMTRKLTETYRK